MLTPRVTERRPSQRELVAASLVAVVPKDRTPDRPNSLRRGN